VASYRVLCDILKEHEFNFEDDWHIALTRAGVELPVLYALKFWRVILDESHSIRNMKTLRKNANNESRKIGNMTPLLLTISRIESLPRIAAGEELVYIGHALY
jgi:hypothetical protein